MLKRPHYIALGIVIALSVGLLKLPKRAAMNLKLAFSGMFLPVSGLTGSLEELAEQASYAALSRRQLIRQIEELRQTNQLLQVRFQGAAEWKRENDRLHDQLKLVPHPAWNLKMAHVVSRDPVNWWRTLRIDRGARDGVVTNAPVLTPAGLVGRVSEVGFAQAQVVLVGDPNCRVAVAVGGAQRRDRGVIAPSSSSPLDATLVELSYLSGKANLTAGDRVYTAGTGEGGIFPSGILVGQVADFRTVGYGLYNEALVRLAVEMNQLEEVWVMMP
jgi:rod shape-determining protein MreC